MEDMKGLNREDQQEGLQEDLQEEQHLNSDPKIELTEAEQQELLERMRQDLEGYSKAAKGFFDSDNLDGWNTVKRAFYAASESIYTAMKAGLDVDEALNRWHNIASTVIKEEGERRYRFDSGQVKVLPDDIFRLAG